MTDARDEIIAKLKAELARIAGGHAGTEVSLDQSPDDFRHAMWVWSQKVAKEALKQAERATEPDYIKDLRHEKLMTGNWENS